MSKKLKKESKYLSLWLVIGFVGVLAVSGFALAIGNNVTVQGDYIEAPAGEGSLGGVTFSDEYFKGDIYAESGLTVTGATTLTGAVTLTGDVSAGILTTGGGDYNSTTTDADTYTLVTADIENYSYLDLDHAGAANITYTMPATSTMIALLPEVGSTRNWIIHNASTTAVLTLAAGAGTNLLGIDTNVDTIAADGWATLECIQSVYAAATNENISCLMAEFVVAD